MPSIELITLWTRPKASAAAMNAGDLAIGGLLVAPDDPNRIGGRVLDVEISIQCVERGSAG